ncbi:intradiol ring-cleavage dioxygenase [Chthonobacter rhizosphaerae]|uniref:dioxygenase family protein n=1 Tax=Chthonobacter rhizosphaerae TaxID=2735553 RepID=UPI0015EF6BC6|nr:intradiol ring-cleavage dioxygenase [Chthonobacter rhizosphaerae]
MGYITRRSFLAGTLAFPAGLSLLRPAVGQELQPTLECGAATERQTEGPYFKPKSPNQRNLVPAGFSGETFQLVGFVLDTRCRPVEGALVDLWHADETGTYDNSGFRSRGHQYTDARGQFAFETVTPGLYPGRTRHFHLKVQAPGGPVLTTQLYFPNERGNRRDGLYDPSLEMAVTTAGPVRRGRFDFVVRTA